MPVVKHRVQKIFTINRVPSDLLDNRALSFLKNHPVEKFVTLFDADILPYHIINIVIWVQDFNLNMEQTRFAFNAHEITRFLVEQLAIYINLHI